MAADVIRLHPDAMEVLREVAAQPGSVLLKAPKRDVVRAMEPNEALARSTDVALTRAERHLVSVYREELAFALRQAAWHKLIVHEPGGRHIYLKRTPTLVANVPTEREVAVEASDALRFSGEMRTYETELEMLEHCTSGSAVRWASVECLCAAAHRLVPSSRGRLIAGSALALHSEYRAAMDCFAPVIQHEPNKQIQALAWRNLGDVLGRTGEVGMALAATQRACTLHPGVAYFHTSRLYYAIALGRSDEAEAATLELAELAAGWPTATAESVVVLGAMKALHPRDISIESQLAGRLRELGGEPLKELFDALV